MCFLSADAVMSPPRREREAAAWAGPPVKDQGG
jgi:hypothetical protein